MIQVNMTEAEFQAKARELKQKFDLDLTEPAGRITKDGVTAGYTHFNDQLTIHILDKPFFISTEYCEQKLQEWLAQRGPNHV
jgi:hypothetical protein